MIAKRLACTRCVVVRRHRPEIFVPKRADLALREVAPVPERERAEPHRAERHSMKPRDGMSHKFEHPSHLPIHSLMQRDLQTRRRALCPFRSLHPKHLHSTWARCSLLSFKLKPAARNALQRVRPHVAFDLHAVPLGVVVPRVREHVHPVVIVCEEQQPCGLAVESAARYKPQLARVGHQVHHRAPRYLVMRRRYEIAWFVQHDPHRARRQPQTSSSHGDHSAPRIDARSRRGHSLPVHRDVPVLHNFIYSAARRDAHTRQHLVKSLILSKVRVCRYSYIRGLVLH
mmetsp:Transcript_10782/g.22945  ORF Transcript_10782/g.22945 Transcript_10782/m.22945 type:complete len:286 (+) Transcript_10782:129-986(+)